MRRLFAVVLTVLLCLPLLAGCGGEARPAVVLKDLNGKSVTDTLMCSPAVFVVEDNYEILVLCKKSGLIYIKVDDEIYRPENSGVLSTGEKYAKIRLPQKVLDTAGKYTVCCQKTVKRLAYYSLLGKLRELEFEFRPVTKTDGLRIYHLADIHGNFDLALRCLDDFGRPDLLICNGDMIDQHDSVKSYYKACRFLGEAGGGALPIVYSRGNHETRGGAAELYGDFFPCENGNCFYHFSVGPIDGIVLDCGEDKSDGDKEYGGVNDFASYRRRETEFLKNLSFPGDGRWRIVVSHICPSTASTEAGDKFDIERGVYGEWVRELERLDINCMFCGHIHSYFMFGRESEYNLIPHDFPIFTASMLRRGKNRVFGGAAIVLNENDMTVDYTDSEHRVIGSYRLVRGDPNVVELLPQEGDAGDAA